MTTLSVLGSDEPVPERILCQTEAGSCAACCGLYNFTDRSPEATHKRLAERTRRVMAAFPDVDALAAVRDALLEEERCDILFATVRVCPYAGYVEDGRVGCLLHPLRHPSGEDLRDLAVYPREVCAGHFCAPHSWLRPREMDFAATVRGVDYGRVVTDAGLVKALVALLEDRLCRRMRASDIEGELPALDALWTLVLDWPFRDPDPHRFGGFQVTGDDAVERSLPSALAGLEVNATRDEVIVLDALGSAFRTADDATRALGLIRVALDEVSAALATG